VDANDDDDDNDGGEDDNILPCSLCVHVLLALIIMICYLLYTCRAPCLSCLMGQHHKSCVYFVVCKSSLLFNKQII